jgi:tetraacyldisaccharide 4'-kinase
MLPYGTLREPPGAVKRAGAVIFTRAEGDTVPAEAADPVGDIPVFFSRHEPAGLAGGDGGTVEPGELSGREIALFSGIARPASFERTAADFGLDASVSFRYDDHHVYTEADVREMLSEAGEDAVFVTTAKDWAKAARLFPLSVTLLRLEMAMVIDGIDELLDLAQRRE